METSGNPNDESRAARDTRTQFLAARSDSVFKKGPNRIIFEVQLDKCMVSQEDGSYEIDFTPLTEGKGEKETLEQAPWYKRVYMKHPVYESILILKWEKCRNFFAIDAIFFILFAILFSFVSVDIVELIEIRTYLGNTLISGLTLFTKIWTYILMLRSVFMLFFNIRYSKTNKVRILWMICLTLTIEFKDTVLLHKLISPIILLLWFHVFFELRKIRTYSHFVAYVVTGCKIVAGLLTLFAPLFLGPTFFIIGQQFTDHYVIPPEEKAPCPIMHGLEGRLTDDVFSKENCSVEDHESEHEHLHHTSHFRKFLFYTPMTTLVSTFKWILFTDAQIGVEISHAPNSAGLYFFMHITFVILIFTGWSLYNCIVTLLLSETSEDEAYAEERIHKINLNFEMDAYIFWIKNLSRKIGVKKLENIVRKFMINPQNTKIVIYEDRGEIMVKETNESGERTSVITLPPNTNLKNMIERRINLKNKLLEKLTRFT